jgi:ABC-type sugar transport system substrate-binding protein
MLLRWAIAGFLPIGLVVGLLAGVSCSPSDGDAKQAARKTVGVTLLTVQHQFYQDLRAGLVEEADRRGYRLLISTAEFDSARQANQIDEFIVQKVDALVVCPCDSRSVGASIAAANKANIPVFTAARVCSWRGPFARISPWPIGRMPRPSA